MKPKPNLDRLVKNNPKTLIPISNIPLYNPTVTLISILTEHKRIVLSFYY